MPHNYYEPEIFIINNNEMCRKFSLSYTFPTCMISEFLSSELPCYYIIIIMCLIFYIRQAFLYYRAIILLAILLQVTLHIQRAARQLSPATNIITKG